ncbi:MAG: hypothetical protein VXV74_01045 [Pseudomonadota bacterium]|nr:hypothetical protein [Pseudomonadota bacterium]
MIGTLGSAAALAAKYDLQPPSIIVIGDVVDLHNELSWFGAAFEVQD